MVTFVAYDRIISAKPVISSEVSPFMRSAISNAAICAAVASPDISNSIAPADWFRVKCAPSQSNSMISYIVGVVNKGACFLDCPETLMLPILL